MRKRINKTFFLVNLVLCCNILVVNANDPILDISVAPIIINGNSTENYIITGSTDKNNIIVETGYKGIITLRDVKIELTHPDPELPPYPKLPPEPELPPRPECPPQPELPPEPELPPYPELPDPPDHPQPDPPFSDPDWDAYWALYNFLLDQWYAEYYAIMAPYWDLCGIILQPWREECIAIWAPWWVEYDAIMQPYWDECNAILNPYWDEFNAIWDLWYSQRPLHSPISVKGQNNCSNLTPVTNVDFILEGDNYLSPLIPDHYREDDRGWSAFHVEQGAQINISAINPSDNSSGTLSAISHTRHGGTGIGALAGLPEATIDLPITGGCQSPATAAGGNIVISSGKITARGGHGAGIGGGFSYYYDGMIVIYGGEVNASSIFHAAGIGSGCPLGTGIVPCYTSNSSIIVLPPATIAASGSGHDENVPIFDLALAGTNTLVYIGDPQKPEITVHTEDFEPFANIYVDLSENPDIARVINATVPNERLDINQVKFGQANNAGIYTFNGILNDNTTFFTDAVSSQPEYFGRPYLPKTVRLPGPNSETVILELMKTDLTIEAFPSISICENNYSDSTALNHAFRIKITYLDGAQMSNVIFEMAEGNLSDFLASDMKFYSSDGETEISTPTTINKGDILFVAIPIKLGKSGGFYSDVLRISGNWGGVPTGYIRQIVTQNIGIVNITVIANPEEGGSVIGTDSYTCDTDVTVSATPADIYNFVNWTENDIEVSDAPNYNFIATEDRNLVANFTLKSYEIVLYADPTEGGTVSGEGEYTYGESVTVSATENELYHFVNWTENNVVVSDEPNYTFIITQNRNLVANFVMLFLVTVDVNNSDYGSAAGNDFYRISSFAQVRAFENDCYRFENWSINGVVVSTDNPYSFEVTENVTITANFSALDFDTYSPILWDNTFLLNLKKLREDGYEVTGCQWYKDDIEQIETNTINEFSYSEGPNSYNLLKPAPTYYMFKLKTQNFGNLCSTNKFIDNGTTEDDDEETKSTLIVYPNPFSSGVPFTIEGVTAGKAINIYNQMGVCVYNTIATDEIITLKLNFPAGFYFIHADKKQIKIEIVK